MGQMSGVRFTWREISNYPGGHYPGGEGGNYPGCQSSRGQLFEEQFSSVIFIGTVLKRSLS